MHGKTMLKAGGVLAAVSMGLASVPAHALTWNLANFTQNGTGYGNSFTDPIPIELTVTAFATTGTGGALQTANIANYGTGSGFGVRNQIEGTSVSSPNHAMDNYGSTDMLLFSFTSSVQLDKIMIGWSQTDSDISLLRWTGGAFATPAGNTIAQLTSGGWSLVNNYANLPQDSFINTGASGGSMYWLLSAYNSAWGTGTNTSNLDNGNDYMKVWKIDTSTPRPPNEVPEPGSMALLALGIASLAIMRRRTKS